MRDKYNLNTLPATAGGLDDHEIGNFSSVFVKTCTILNYVITVKMLVKN